jgi:hypothetical protein
MRAIQISASSGVRSAGKIKAAHRHRVGESGERGGVSVPPSRVGLLAWLSMDGPSRPKKCTYNLRVQTHAHKKQKAAAPPKHGQLGVALAFLPPFFLVQSYGLYTI